MGLQISEIITKKEIQFKDLKGKTIAIDAFNAMTHQRSYNVVKKKDDSIAELKKNASGISYLTPHNITLKFTSNNGDLYNYSFINLTQTNNTIINLGITLNCTSPSSYMNITNSTTFCPGNFNVERIYFRQDNIEASCYSTTFSGSALNYGVIIIANNVTLTNCTFSGYCDALTLYQTQGVTIDKGNFTDCGSSTGCSCISLEAANNNTITNSYLSGGHWSFLLFGNENIISNNTITNSDYISLLLDGYPTNNSIINNSLSNGPWGIYFSSSSFPLNGSDGIF